MKRALKTYSRIVDQHAKPMGLALLGITLFFGYQTSSIVISQEIDTDAMPESNQLVQNLNEVKKTFGDNSKTLVVSLETQNKVTDPDNLKLIKRVSRALKKVPSVKRTTILSFATVKDFEVVGDDIRTEPILKAIPKNQAEQVALEERIKSNPLVFGRIVSKDFKTALVVASVYTNADVKRVHHEVAAVMDPLKGQVPDSKLVVLGDPEINYRINSSIESDVAIFLGVSMILITLALFMIFRTWQGVVIPLTAVVTAILWTMGLIGLYGEPITIVTAILPVVLVVVGSSCALHIYFNFIKERSHDANFQRIVLHGLEKIFSPLVMAGITTFVGGITLLVFKIKPLQNFGVFSAVGSLICLVAALLVIPVLFRLVGTGTRGAARNALEHMEKPELQTVKVGWLVKLSKFSTERPYFVVVALILTCGLSALYSTRMDIGYDNLSFLPKNDPVRTAAVSLKKRMNGLRSFDLTLDTKYPNGILEPEFLAKVHSFQDRLEEFPEVSRTFSVVDLVAKVQQVFNPKSPDLLPKDADTTAQYLFLIGMGSSIQSYLSNDQRKLRISVTMTTNDTRATEGVYLKVKDMALDHFGEGAIARVGGFPMMMVALMRYLVWGKIQNMLMAMLLIFLIVTIRYRSVVRGMITSLPLPIGVITNFGLMGYLGIRLDFVTAIITSFAMGIGIDFSIHFVAALRKSFKETGDMSLAVERAVSGPGTAILYNAIICVAGFSVLGLSRFAPVNTFALLMCFNMAVLMVATFVVLPAVIQIFRPQFVTGELGYRTELGRKIHMASKVAMSTALVAILTLGIYVAEAKSAPTPESLLKKSVKASHADHEESIYVMRLIGKDGKESAPRKMNVWFQSQGENVQLMIKFKEPANIRGTGFLSVINKDSASQWLYLPAMKKARRVSGGNSDEPFLGSDFTMGDISVDKKGGFEFKLEGEKECQGGQCYVLIGTPKDEDSLYSKQIRLIHKDNHLNVRSEFYNAAGQLEKVMTLKDIKKDPQGRMAPGQVEMKNMLTGHRTVIEYAKRDTSKKPSSRVFTKRFLEK